MLASLKTSRLDKLSLLSPHWNMPYDPLLAWPLTGLPLSLWTSCVDLVRELARLVVEEAFNRNSQGRLRLLERALQYNEWILEHEPDPNVLEYADLRNQLSRIRLSSADLYALPFWNWSLVRTKSERGDLPIQRLSTAPVVLLIDDVISDADCAELATWQDGLYRPPPTLCVKAPAYWEKNFKLRAHDVWAKQGTVTCYSAKASSSVLSQIGYVSNYGLFEGIGTTGLPFVGSGLEALRKFDEFISVYIGLPREHAKQYDAVRYPKTIGYGGHVDCTSSLPRFPVNKERMVSALLYFSTTDGGETVFTKLGKKVEPKCGRLLIWQDLESDGSCNQLTFHEAAAVRNATKRILQGFYSVDADVAGRLRPPPPSSLPGYQPLSQVVYCPEATTNKCREQPMMGNMRPPT